MATSLKALFVEEPSSHLFCPCCKNLLDDPVISVTCGHTFCKCCLTDGHGKVVLLHCPVDNKGLNDTEVVPNRAISSQIGDLVVYCRHGIQRLNSREDVVEDDSGCPQQICLKDRKDHESCCDYETVECPNSLQCGQFQRRHLEEHCKTCYFVSCLHHDKGCDFTGTAEMVEEHELECENKEKPVVRGVARDEVQRLHHENKELDKKVSILTEKVSFLERSKETLSLQLEQCQLAIVEMEKKFNEMNEKLENQQKKLKSPSFRRTHTRTNSGGSVSSIRVNRNSSFNELSFSGSDPWQLPFEFKCIGTLRGHNSPIHCLATRKHQLYSSGGDNVIKVWNVEALSKGCVQNMQGHTDKVTALLTTREYLYSASADKSIRMWKYDAATEYKCRKDAHEEEVCCLAIAGLYLFSSSHSTIKVWDVETLDLIKTISGLHHWVRALALDPMKEYLYSGSHNTVAVWDARGEFAMKRQLDHQFGSVYSLLITNLYIIMGTYNRNILIFDVNTHEHLSRLGGHIGIVTDLAASPGQQFFISGSYDCTIRIWNLENFLSLQVLSRHQGSVNAITLKNGLLFTGSEDKEIKIFKYFGLTTYPSFGTHIRPGKDM
ncbi:E3 ubiquitin-protein ligase TRAF7-like isoform X3 [Amphiura filiformis]|uniref:E3 ubiquitin-protein ligase TRAF7-like isoform X3 n=1 Tax=Amphiura filiformis TaxID=82378 RepID=UPI003B210A2B